MLLPIAGPALGQSDPEPSAVTAEVAQVSSAALAAQVDASSAELQRVLESLEVFDTALVSIPEQREALSEELSARLSLLVEGEIENLSEAEADTLLQTFRRMERQLDQWERLLQERTDQLEQQRERLQGQRDFIATALEADESASLPDALAERSAELAQRLLDARQRLGERLSTILEELSQISDFRTRLDDAEQRAKASMQRLPGELLERDQPFLWEAFATDRPSWSGLLDNIKQRRDSTLEFISAMSSEFLAFLVIGAMLILAAVIVRFRMPGEDPGKSERTLFARRPVATVVLLWALIGVEIFLEPSPLAVGTVRVLLISFALFLLVPEILGAAVRLPATVLVAMAALANMAYLLQTGGLIWRLCLGVVAVASAWAFLRLRDGLPETAPSGKNLWLWIARGVTWVAPYALGGALLALLFGFSNLAEQLIDGVLLLLVAALALLIIEQVLTDFIDFVLAYAGQKGIRSLQLRPALLKQRLVLGLRILMLILLASLLTQIFPLVALIWDEFTVWLSGDLEIGTASFAIIDLLVLVFALLVSILVARIVRVLLAEDVFPRFAVASGAGEAISRLIYYALVTAGVLFALAASGVELTKLTLVVSALGVGIGFGLQGIVNNFVSGLILSFERPIQVGDTIAAGTLTGRVTQIGLRATRIRTFEGAEVIVPNADLISSNVVNWTLSDRTRRLDLPVQVAYGTDLDRARDVLTGVAAAHDAVASAPAPDVLFQGYGENSLELWLRVWLPESGEWPLVRSQIFYAMDKALKDAGIEVPFPQRVVHLRDERTADEPKPVAQPDD